MPRTVIQTSEVQIIGGIFSTRENDDQGMEGFPNLDIPRRNNQVFVNLDSKQAKEAFAGAVVKAIRNGNIRVAAHNVAHSASLVDPADYRKVRAKLLTAVKTPRVGASARTKALLMNPLARAVGPGD